MSRSDSNFTLTDNFNNVRESTTMKYINPYTNFNFEIILSIPKILSMVQRVTLVDKRKFNGVY